MYLEDAYTVPASLAGLPGLSLPCGFTESQDEEKENLPIGLQMLVPRMKEQKLLEIAHVLEQKLDLRDQLIPKGFET